MAPAGPFCLCKALHNDNAPSAAQSEKLRYSLATTHPKNTFSDSASTAFSLIT